MTKEQIQWREALEQSKAFSGSRVPLIKDTIALLKAAFELFSQEPLQKFQINLGEGFTLQDQANLPGAVGGDDKIPVKEKGNVSAKPKGAKDTNRVRHYRPMP